MLWLLSKHEIREETLPFDEIPLDLICPVCHKGPYQTENGLRGHAYGSHKLKWQTKPKPPKPPRPWKASMKDTADLKDVADLKAWHRMAILQHHILGTSWAKIGAVMGKSTSHMTEVAASPAGEKFRAELDELVQDTPALVRMAIQAGSLGLAVDDAAALEWAKDAKDYAFVHKFVQDYFKIAGVVEPQEKNTQQAIHLHLTTDALSIPTIQTSHEEIKALVEGEDWKDLGDV